jgi:TolA-binding protein
VHARGSVHGQPGARFAAGSPGPDEVVRLEDGMIAVEVEPLGPGERFRVIVGDAEIEVRGTAFDVTARDDHLVDVTVHHGRVEVRPRGGPMTTLVANQAWHAPEVREAALARGSPAREEAADGAPRSPLARNEPSGPRDAARPPRSVAPPVIRPSRARPAAASEHDDVTGDAAPRELTVSDHPKPAPARPPEELAYDDGWAAMRTGNFARAATSFARVFIVAPDSSLAEDATFWHAVALARGGRRAEAINAFRDFLELQRRSTHAGEASAMLGWILLEAHDRDEAARRFRDAAGDPNPAVSTSARAGLAALAPK